MSFLHLSFFRFGSFGKIWVQHRLFKNLRDWRAGYPWPVRAEPEKPPKRMRPSRNCAKLIHTYAESDSDDSDDQPKRSNRRKISQHVNPRKDGEQNEISEYEQDRQTKIRRNEEVLRSLGLPTASARKLQTNRKSSRSATKASDWSSLSPASSEDDGVRMRRRPKVSCSSHEKGKTELMVATHNRKSEMLRT